MPEMGHRTSGMKLTYEDLVRLPDDGKRHELLDGEHSVTPAPDPGHQAVVLALGALLWHYLEEHPIGEIYIAPLDVVLTLFDVVEPDLLYFSHARGKMILSKERLTGPPELVVEVASPSTHLRDQTVKRSLYERAGVTEYWFIEPILRTVTIYSRTGPDRPFSVRTVLGESDIVTTDLLPDLRIPLSRVFKRTP